MKTLISDKLEIHTIVARSVRRDFLNLGTRSLPADEHPYLVYVVNRCNWTITGLIDTNNNFHPYNPPIGRTCVSDFETCKANHNFALLAGSNCDATPYRFALRCHHPKGYTGDTDFVTINPDCNFGGVVIDFDIPDPTL